MPSIPLNVRVSTVDSELDLVVQPKTTGQSLFEMVVSAVGLRETWYFGLSYTNSRNELSWINMKKKLSKQDIKKDQQLHKIQLKFKYYPESVEDNVIQDLTLKFLYKQVKKEILDEVIYCPAEKAVLLASLSAQAKFGDYDPAVHKPGYLANENILPQKVMTQYTIDREEWEKKITSFHEEHRRRFTTEEAILEYLKTAENLEMYGIAYFPAKNARGTDVFVGVDPSGINVYEKTNKLKPTTTFPWSEIKKINHTKDKFKVQFSSKDAKAFQCKVTEPRGAEKIYDISTGNYNLYATRRSEESLEVKNMRLQKQEEMNRRKLENQALQREIKAREVEEKRRAEIEEKLKRMQEDMEKRGQELQDALATIQKLQNQLQETQENRAELERQQNELRAMLDKLEADREMEASEKLKLEQEIAEKQAEIENVRANAESKEEEAARLQEEIENAKRQLMETTEAMQKASELAAQSAAEAAEALRREEELRARKQSSSSSSSSESGDKNDGETNEDAEKKTQEMLKSLREDLEDKRDVESEADRQYREYLAEGRDKFKTLREIRRGNTKRRIDSFENM